MKKREAESIRDYIVGSEKGWETVVDFTDGGKTEGVPAEEVIKMIKK